MRRHIGLLWIAGFFGSIAAADAQTTPPSAAVTAFDGTYVFVSASKVNETYTTGRSAKIGQCRDIRSLGPLVIRNGQVRYAPDWTGTVGPQGELAMRLASPTRAYWAGERAIVGSIDGAGTVRARRTDYYCNYDFVWQKAPK